MASLIVVVDAVVASHQGTSRIQSNGTLACFVSLFLGRSWAINQREFTNEL
jgi:hypothetical protein